MLKKLITIISLIALPLIGTCDALYWQVDQNTTVHNADGTSSSLYSFLVPFPYRNEDNQPINVDSQGRPITDGNGNYVRGNGVQDAIVGARINVYGADGTWLRTLENFHGNVIDDSWHSPVDIGHPSAGHVGASAGSTSLNGVSTDLDEYYQIALLSRNETEWNGNPVFQEIAWTALYSGELLNAEGHYDLNASSIEEIISAWIPMDYYTYKPVPMYDYGNAPEPNSCILILFGVAILLLRRKES